MMKENLNEQGWKPLLLLGHLLPPPPPRILESSEKCCMQCWIMNEKGEDLADKPWFRPMAY